VLPTPRIFRQRFFHFAFQESLFRNPRFEGGFNLRDLLFLLVR
jgi:hypothetical protein